jgi:hypothetical protein
LRSTSWLKTAAAWVAAGATAAACTYGIPPLHQVAAEGGDEGSSSGGDDEAEGEDSPLGAETGPDASDCLPAGYHDMTQSGFWSLFDTSMVVTGNPQEFAGGTFDGRYVVLAPYQTGFAVQFDTQAPFGDKGSWSSYDVSSVSGGSTGFFGAGFDGQYTYFTPYSAGTQATEDGVVVRYDSKGAFGNSGSWSRFDAQSVNMNAEGFAGQAFDGKYLYFVPDLENVAVKMDTTAYGESSSLSFFDTTLLGNQTVGYVGAVYDGHHVNFVPDESTVVAQYDTAGEFDAEMSWTTFDVANITAPGTEFVGGVFDGRYVYLVPNSTDTATSSKVPRYDTTASIGSSGSWTVFDVSSVNPSASGFLGGAFDGRYVYFVPWANAWNPSQMTEPNFDGVIVRFDTTAGPNGFTQASSWSSFDTGTLSSNATGFFGAVFDGRYLYLVPDVSTYVARFDARCPPTVPGLSASYGSFF